MPRARIAVAVTEFTPLPRRAGATPGPPESVTVRQTVRMLPTPPSLASVSVARSAPVGADALGVFVRPTGAVPRQVGIGRGRLAELGFEAKPGQTLLLPGRDGPSVVAVGVADTPDTTQLRDAAAAVVRAVPKAKHVALQVGDLLTGNASELAAGAQALVEGALLAGYRYAGLKSDPAAGAVLAQVTLAVGGKGGSGLDAGVARGTVTARAAALARELANTPASHLTARQIAELAVSLGQQHGFTVEVFGKDQLAQLGCGGILGVNAGSTEPPRMVKLTYTPRRRTGAHIALVGKGVMYDSGGLSLKPTNAMSALMKLDMSGAAAVLATMTALADLKCPNRVSAWLMCTDNMPSGSALKLGDVLRIRNGKTVEILNTDAEGRLILADGLSLASEEQPDAIVDIATLTGSALNSLGEAWAAVLGTDAALLDRVRASAAAADEPVWELPLTRDKYRSQLDSTVADLKNVGGSYAGAIIAGIFLSEFVGNTPWAHIDIAGTMHSDSDRSWRSKGATGFGTRLLIDLVTSYGA